MSMFPQFEDVARCHIQMIFVQLLHAKVYKNLEIISSGDEKWNKLLRFCLVLFFLFRIFATAMNRLRRGFVWLRRVGHCRGLGIQSPTDYRFVRNVISETWPFHAYDELPNESDWMLRKLGRLYFRLANDRQPHQVIDRVGVMDYVSAGCKKAEKVDNVDVVELAIVPIAVDYDCLLSHCDEQSVVVFQDIYKQKPLWHCIEYDQRVRVTFDLYYCGIVLFDKKRAPNNYIVNF